MSMSAQIVRYWFDPITGNRCSTDVYTMTASGGYSPDVANDLKRQVIELAAADRTSTLDEHFHEIADCLDEGDES